MAALGPLERAVQVVRTLAAVTTVAFVILLFTNEPQTPPPPPAASADAGAQIYATRCASCHGEDGSGGFGPPLAGVVIGRFPDPADQAAVVAAGRGAMPTFEGSLTPEEIDQVVEYTRSQLG